MQKLFIIVSFETSTTNNNPATALSVSKGILAEALERAGFARVGDDFRDTIFRYQIVAEQAQEFTASHPQDSYYAAVRNEVKSLHWLNDNRHDLSEHVYQIDAKLRSHCFVMPPKPSGALACKQCGRKPDDPIHPFVMSHSTRHPTIRKEGATNS